MTDKLIIGAGLYGLYAALFCARKGQSVVVLEREQAPFTRATYINQARVHMGYHYPRSLSTAVKSAGYFQRFVQDYGFCIHSRFDQVYATSSHFSWTDAAEFRKFCRDADIPCLDLPVERYFKPGVCDGAFLTREYTYDARILRDYFLEELAKYPGVSLLYGRELLKIVKQGGVFEAYVSVRDAEPALGKGHGQLVGGNSESGNSECGNSESGNSECGNSESGNSEIGNSEYGNSESGNSECGNSECSNSEHGGAENHGKEERYEAPFVLNATYASVNQVLALTEGIDNTPFALKYELCEIILCRVEEKLRDLGITVMDGPFFSIMPFGKTGFHSLTSVTFTPHKTSYVPQPQFACAQEGECTERWLGNCDACPKRPDSAWEYMSALARKYMRDEYSFTYEKSLFSMKPILKASEIDDSRPTMIRLGSREPVFLSVLSGKINTVYDLDEFLD